MANNTVMAKPKKFSAPIYRAPVGTTCPTDAVAEIDQSFKSIGSISEDGFSEDLSRETEEIKRWGGDTVQIIQTGKKDTFKFTLIDYLDVERQKVTFGDGNVTGTLETGITIVSNGDELGEHAYVIDEILTGGILQRTVIPRAKVSELGEMKHVDNDVIAQEVTLVAIGDDDGVTFTRYIIKSA